jgi:hypothetical protein
MFRSMQIDMLLRRTRRKESTMHKTDETTLQEMKKAVTVYTTGQ